MQRSLCGIAGRVALGGLLLAVPSFAQVTLSGGRKSLDQVPVPRPPNLADFVKNEQAAIALGKAFLWDQQVGSDGRPACATCHHAAGADSRRINTVNPGPNHLLDLAAAGGSIGAGSFPVLTDDVIGSQGVPDNDFVHVNIGNRIDTGIPTANAVFGRQPQVTGRQAPTYINPVYQEVFFWDGRAANTFDGRSVKPRSVLEPLRVPTVKYLSAAAAACSTSFGKFGPRLARKAWTNFSASSSLLTEDAHWARSSAVMR